ncbi:MFS transporter [Schaalia vaccimaxillae]|uniref:MFS transporter n=1 Tax=Schaalia vaccimaxillae TaxID=183916 RepID=UPI0003B450E4|nr:MFS transporter [Schaalia vaccimaxillae]
MPNIRTRVRRARIAVFVLFLTNGALFANLVPRYPEVKDIFGLSDPIYGLTIACFPAGAMTAGPLAGWVIRRIGSARTAAWGTTGIGLMLILVGIMTAWRHSIGADTGTTGVAVAAQALFMLGFFCAGGADAVTDVGQNAHGLRVQRVIGRPVINSFHAGWSIGCVMGGLIGSAATALAIPLQWHLIAAALVFMVVGQVALRFCLPGNDPADGQPDPVTVMAGAGSAPTAEVIDIRVRTARIQPIFVVTALTLLTIAGMLVEDGAQTWATLYMRDALGAVGGVAGSAYVLALASQAVGRLTADRMMEAIGARNTLFVGGGLITVGMGLAVLVQTVPTTLIGFAMAGFGCASTVPIAMNAADDIPGLKPGQGLTIVSWLGRLAFLCAPPVVGFLVERTSLISALVVLPIAGMLALVTATVVAKRSD